MSAKETSQVSKETAKMIKKKRVSKKSKKSWRKATDIADVEEHIEEIRQQERTGGIVSEKQNEELFFMDKDVRDRTKVNTEKTRTRPKINKILHEDSSSGEEEFVPRKKRLLNEKQPPVSGNSIVNVANDLWGSVSEVTKNKNIDDSFVKDTMKKQPKKPKTFNKKAKSDFTAVEISDAGASYNPDFDSHQDLLLKAHKVEVDKLKKQEKLDRKVNYMNEEEFKKLPTWLEEMSQGLCDEKEDRKKESRKKSKKEEESEVYVKPSNSEDRKPLKERKKQKLRKEENMQKEAMKLESVRRNDIYRLRSIKKSIKKEEEVKTEKLRIKKDKEIESLGKTKRLGKYKYVEPNLPIQLSDELAGSLRSLKPEGNLFQERFKNLQKRNLIEPRKPVRPHRKYKLKEYEKRSYKTLTIKEIPAVGTRR